jgi:transposase
MHTITTIGLDIAKSVFQVHGIDAEGKVVIRRQLKRRYVLVFFQKLPLRAVDCPKATSAGSSNSSIFCSIRDGP